ncbi:MAG: cation transporter [Lachnospiraceae bacterium]|nr:cation transporter [Lachnospiraceae bacterium]
MFGILSRFLIKDYTDYQNPIVRRAYGQLAGVLGIIFNLLLFLGKYVAGFISGSVSMMADALNNLSDAGSSVVTLIGFHFAGKKPDSEHPFGHGRIEYISGLVVAGLIMYMGLELLQSSFRKILHPETMEIQPLTLVVLVISILVKVYMSIYNRIYGKRIDSSAMRATAIDSLSDCIATSVVLLSMILYYFTRINLDGISGLIVAVFILIAGYSAAKETLSPLLGEAPDAEFVKSVEELVLAHKDVVGIHDMIVHDYGPGRRMISLHAEVSGKEDVYKLHDLMDVIEYELRERFQCEAVLHMDPIEADDEKVMGLRKEVERLVKEMDEELSIHDFRMVEGPTHTNLIFDVVLPQGYARSDEEVSLEIQQRILAKWQNYFAVIKVEKKYI